MKAMVCEELCEECRYYGTTGTDHCEKDAIRMAIQALDEIQQYREIGTVKELQRLRSDYERVLKYNDDQGEIIDSYEAIGTLDECREAVERMKPKKPRKGGVMGFDGEEGAYCPNCGLDNMAWGMSVCVDCGQAFDWSE